MRGAVIFMFILAFVGVGHAQQNKISDLAFSLSNLHCRNDAVLLKRAFRESHYRYLKHYKAYAEIEDVFKTGDFDCLSGTLFFSKLLDNLGFEYKIFETNYHIFLIAKTSKGPVLIETTDKQNGIVTDNQDIEERLSRYQSSISQPSSLYLSQLDIFNQVTPLQMEGLVLFNRAVCSFRQKDFLATYNLLEKSKTIYDSPRICEFAKILIQEIAMDNYEGIDKKEMIAKVKLLIDEKTPFASLQN